VILSLSVVLAEKRSHRNRASRGVHVMVMVMVLVLRGVDN
jgi:hypothetical protein